MSYRYPPPGTGHAMLMLGVVLPTAAILFELLTGWCAEVFFDPLPTFAHLLLVAAVPVVNVLLWLVARDEGAGARWLAVAAGGALAVAGSYALLTLPILPVAIIAVLMMGLGLLPFAPSSAAFVGVRLIGRIDWGRPIRWQVGGGMLAGFALLALADVRGTAVQVALNDYAGTATERERAVGLMRTIGDRAVLLRIAHGDGAVATGLVSALTAFGSGPFRDGTANRSEDARELYYRVTGTPFNAAKRPDTGLAARRAWFSFDEDLGGEQVGARVEGLSLAASRIDGSAAVADNLAYVEWTVEVANAAAVQNEARFTLALPEGAVASRATLWVNGVPREASVAGRAEARAAYQSVVSARRDPLLVTTDGAGRLLVQAFPIQPGGRMRLRVGYTAPFTIAADGARRQALPAIVERNFEIAPDLAHNVWIDGDAPLTPIDPRLHRAGSALRGRVTEATLGPVPPAFGAGALTAGSVRTGTIAAAAKMPALAVEQRIARGRGNARSLTILLDASAPMAPTRAALAEALAALPAGLPVGLIVAADEPVKVAPAPWSPNQRERILAALDRLTFAGGQDSTAALADALGQAAVPGGRVLWIHGAQPVDFLRSRVALDQLLARATTLPQLIRYQPVPGRATTVQGAPLFEGARVVGPSGDMRGDLTAILAGMTGPEWRTTYRKLPGGGVEASAHLVRLWAARELATSGNATGKARGAAIALAHRLNIVTPVSGAVVLESDRETRENGLPVPSADAVPTIPEPETWALLAMLAACAAWAWHRQRRSPGGAFA